MKTAGFSDNCVLMYHPRRPEDETCRFSQNVAVYLPDNTEDTGPTPNLHCHHHENLQSHTLHDIKVSTIFRPAIRSLFYFVVCVSSSSSSSSSPHLKTLGLFSSEYSSQYPARGLPGPPLRTAVARRIQ